MVGSVRPVGPPEVPLIGRSRTVEALLDFLRSAREGRGGLAVLVGSGGVGKTTFLAAAARMGRELGFRVVEGPSLPADLPEPFRLVGALVRSARKETEAPDRADGAPVPSLPMFLAPYETDPTGSAARASGYAEAPPAAREADRLLHHLANPTERIEANRSELLTQLTDFFLHLTAPGPFLLVLDDVQFADESSLVFLRELLPSLQSYPLLVVAATGPTGEAPARTRAPVEVLLAHPAVRRLDLPALTETELAEFVRWLLNGHDPGRELVMRWFTQTEGNPLFAECLVRASTGTSRDAAEPAAGGSQGFSEFLQEHVRNLPDADRRLLVYGAVVGREFDFPIVAEAAGPGEEQLSEALDRLVHDGILREKRGEVYEFVSERSRTDVYAQLTETRRRLLHRKVAAALEHRFRDRPGEVFELARQFYLGRDDPKAVEYNRRAAELSARAFAFDTSIVHLERALDALRRLTPRDPRQEILLLIELGRHLDEVGDLHRSEAVLLDAVAQARSDGSRALVLALALLGLAQTRLDLAQYPSARDLATEAFGILGRLDEPRGQLAAHRVLGVASWRMGHLDEAERHQRDEVALAEAHGSPVELGHALIDLANTFTLRTAEQSEEAMGLYARAAELFARSEDHSAQARVLMNHALLLHYARRPTEALEKMAEALRAAERSRSRIWTGYCCLNISQLYAEQGQLDQARGHLARARDLLEPLGDQLAHQQLTMIRGMVAAAAGEYDAAEALFTEAGRLAVALDLSAEAAEIELRFAELESRRGRPEAARARIASARGAGIERLRADLLPKLADLESILAPRAAEAQG